MIAEFHHLLDQARVDEVSRLALADVLEEEQRYADALDVRHATKVAGESAVHVRWMIRSDVAECAAIAGWDHERLVRLLRRKNTIGMVAEDYHGRRILGFMIYRLNLNKQSLRLLALFVHDDQRDQGVAGALWYRLRRKLSPQRRRSIVANENTLGMCLEWFCLQESGPFPLE